MTDLTWFIILAAGTILNLVGFVGCLLPVLPGPTMNLLALTIVYFTLDNVSMNLLLVMIALVVIALITDNVFPVLTARVGGGTRYGMIGAAAGLVGGFFVFPPYGMLPLSIVGAMLGEFYHQKRRSAAIKAGIATIVGFALSLAFKLGASAVITWHFYSAMCFK